MTHEEIVRALGHLYPSAKYVLSGEDIENIEWLSTDIQCPDFATLEEAYADSIAAEVQAKELMASTKAAALTKLGLTSDELAAIFS
jgi:hypothetical protein